MRALVDVLCLKFPVNCADPKQFMKMIVQQCTESSTKLHHFNLYWHFKEVGQNAPGDTYKYTLKCKTCIFVLAQTKLASLTYYLIETNRVVTLTVDSECRKEIHLVQPFQVVLVQQQQ